MLTDFLEGKSTPKIGLQLLFSVVVAVISQMDNIIISFCCDVV